MRRAMGTGHSFLLEPRALARRGRSWTGTVPVRRFARLAGLVGGDATSVEVRLTFELDAEGRCRVHGGAYLRAGMDCRRCAESVRRDIQTDIDVLVLGSESEARTLTPRHDTCVLTEPKVPVDALVEDDLLLALPEHGCARREDCPHAALGLGRESTGGGDVDRRADGPFAALAGLVTQEERTESVGNGRGEESEATVRAPG